jgi:hypothetical protein
MDPFSDDSIRKTINHIDGHLDEKGRFDVRRPSVDDATKQMQSDDLFDLFDHDKSGTLDREEYALARSTRLPSPRLGTLFSHAAVLAPRGYPRVAPPWLLAHSSLPGLNTRLFAGSAQFSRRFVST